MSTQHMSDITLETIDFSWITSTTKVSHLKRAIALIQQDGNYFTELKDACYQRLEEIDPTNKYLSPHAGASLTTPQSQKTSS